MILGLVYGCGGKDYLFLHYVPQTEQNIGGTYSIADFGYTPPEGHSPFEIPGNQPFDIFLDKPIGGAVSDSLGLELQTAGATLSEQGHCQITGSVDYLYSASLGYDPSYEFDVTYQVVRAAGNATIYQRTISHQKPYSYKARRRWFSDALAASINEFLQDPKFLEAASAQCIG